MDARRLRPALVLSAWTGLVWTTRIRNIWTDESLTTAGQLWRTALAAVFTAFALVVAGTWLRARRTGADVAGWVRPTVGAFALWTTVVWIVRGTQIALGDHSGAFVMVHTVLAAVSIGLAAWAWRAVSDGLSDRARRPVRASGSGSRPLP